MYLTAVLCWRWVSFPWGHQATFSDVETMQKMISIFREDFLAPLVSKMWRGMSSLQWNLSFAFERVRQIGTMSDVSKANIRMKICVWIWEMGTMSSLMYHRCTKRKKMALETFRYSCTNTCRDPMFFFVKIQTIQNS